MSLRRLALAVSLVAVLAAGCLSPTLPLPPPEAPDGIELGADGKWRVAGSCTPGALVTVFNDHTGLGSVVEDKAHIGRYLVELEADACDLAWVAEEVDGEASPITEFNVQQVDATHPIDAPCTP